MRKRLWTVVLLGLSVALAISVCVPLPEQTGPAVAPTEPGPQVEVSTAVPSTSGPMTGTVTTETPATVAPDGSRQITLDDNGKTVTLQAGERVLLFLGEGYNWDLAISDLNVLSRVMGVMTIRGSQGLFEAKQVGTTTISASGDPACRQSQPPCAMPSRTFQVTVIVQGAG